MFPLPHILAIAALFSSAQAQIGGIGGTPLFDNATCLTGPNTTFVNCNTFYSALVNCTSNTTERLVAGCKCRPLFFNLMVDCKSELRICTQDNSWDATLDTQIGGWHDVCDGSGVDVTTPVLSATSGSVSGQTSSTISATIATRSNGSTNSSASAATASLGNKICTLPEMRGGVAILLIILLILAS